MPYGMVFPYDFGFVPSTRAEDGDPLDVLVLTDEPLFPGCLVESTLIGVLKAEQTEERHTNRNDRLIAVADQSLLYSETKTLKDLNPKVLGQMKEFFVNYQKVRGIEVRILGHAGPRVALQILAALEMARKLREHDQHACLRVTVVSCLALAGSFWGTVFCLAKSLLVR